MLANTDRKLLLIDENLKKDSLSDQLMKTSTNISEASSLASSSANSPGLNQASPLLSSASSTSSSSSSIFTKESSSQSSCSTSIKNKNQNQVNAPHTQTDLLWMTRKEEQNVDLVVKQEQVLLNNEGNVKKIISRFLSQAPNAKNNFNPYQQQQQPQSTRVANAKETEFSSNTTGNCLLAISTNKNQPSDSFKSLPSTKCIYYTEKSSAPYMTTIFKRLILRFFFVFIIKSQIKMIECIFIKYWNNYSW